jgi:hypothetical protein
MTKKKPKPLKQIRDESKAKMPKKAKRRLLVEDISKAIEIKILDPAELAKELGK